MKQLTLLAKDGYELSLTAFECKNPKAVIQIMHGMEEHKERYYQFAKFLNESGYTVLVGDMRGHGKNTPEVGFFDSKNGAHILVKDQHEITEYIKATYPNLPIYLFAHSMGTITCRVLIQKYSHDYSKVILSGYPCYNPGAIAGIALCNLVSLFKGKKGHSKFISSLALGGFSKAIKDRKTDLDWLSYNEQNVQDYIQDELCGQDFTIQGFHDLFTLMKKMHKLERYNDLNTCLPILMLSGEDDPCTGGEKGRMSSISRLRQGGFAAIQAKTYPHMRHEILNEDKKEEVYNDSLNFYNL